MIRYTLKIKLRKDRKNKDSRYPIIFQCFLNGQKTVINSGDFIPLDSWDEKKCRVKAGKKLTAQEADEINHTLGEMKQNIERLFHDHRRSGNVLTGDKLKDYLDNPMASYDFHQWVQNQIQQLEGAMADNTIKHYKVSFRRLKDFRPELRIADLSPSLVEEFDIYLKKLGLEVNSRANYHKHLKKFSRILMRAGQCGNIYQFFPIKQRNADRVFLNKQEVATLESMYENQVLHPELHEKLGRFLFSCYTGVRGEGLNSLNWKNYSDGFVKYAPKKLEYISKLNKVPVSERALQLVQNPDGNMFPQLSLQKYNEALKKIARHAGIKKALTSHVGRHTFATGFLMQGGNPRILQEYLGHEDMKTTMIYVHMSEEREKEERHILDNLFRK